MPAPRGCQRRLDLGKRYVPIGRNDLQCRLSVPLDAVGAPVAAEWSPRWSGIPANLFRASASR